jgi:D-alanyl-D-alanine carboxypeptidase
MSRFVLFFFSIGLMACGGESRSKAPPPRPSSPFVTVPSCASSAPPTAPPPSTTDDPPKTLDVAAVDAWIAKQVEKRGLVGLSVAIARDGQIVLVKGYGKKSIVGNDPVTPTTAFPIGSVTKQMACASALVLAEEGKLSFEDRVAKYYPDLTRAKDVTLHDLVSHLAGYHDYYPLDFVDVRMTKPTTPDAVIAKYATMPLDFEPRSRFSYSNTGFLIVGRIVEKLSGQSLAAFMKKRIFEPAGMTHTSLERKDLSDVATGHAGFQLGETEIAPPEAEGWLHAAGGVLASAEDLVKWDIALADKKILKPKSLELMTTPRKLTDGTPTAYACGLGVYQRGPEIVWQHSGAVSGFLAWNTILPRTRSGVAVIVNSEHLDARPIYTELVGLLLKAHETKNPVTVAGVPAADAARELFRAMQRGIIDRSKLGPEFAEYMSEARVKKVAPTLAALGEPEKIDVKDIDERGGAENASLELRFKGGTKVRAILHRSPDGKIQQFLLFK